jgi:subtilisin family serine protease
MAERRVIVVLPAQASLREPAMALRTGERARIERAPAGIPAQVELDPDFTPVPIAQIGATPNLAMANAESAPRFAVRGVIRDGDIETVPVETQGAAVFADPVINAFLAPGCAGGPVGDHGKVGARLNAHKLAKAGLDGTGVAIAIMDNGINLAHMAARGVHADFDASITWSPGSGTAGEYPVHHGTMCAFDALIAAPKATLLDFPVLRSQTQVGSDMDGLLSDALEAYGVLLALMQQPEDQRPYKSLVINNSWGMYTQTWDFPVGHPGRYADNPNHPFNLIVGTLVRAGADVLFAAGNCGADCPDDRCEGEIKNAITGANAHPDVITVAGVTTERRRVGYSSQGPGIKGMAHAKPDVSAYTHFLGSEAFGPGSADGGTSAACPVTAGSIAALRTKLPPSVLPPRYMSRELRVDATKKGGSATGWNKNYGYGIIEPFKTAGRLGLFPVA